MARREDFLRVQSVYMPREMLQAMGLFELPSQCIVNIAPFDTNLLEIDINDVERYAPEALVGRLMKGPDQIMKGSSRSLSNSGFQTSGKDRYIYMVFQKRVNTVTWSPCILEDVVANQLVILLQF